MKDGSKTKRKKKKKKLDGRKETFPAFHGQKTFSLRE